jgi:hypothetical protein
VAIGFGVGSWDATRRDTPAPLLQIEPQTALVLPELGVTLAKDQEQKTSPPANPGDDRASSPNQSESNPDQAPAKTTSRSKSKKEYVGICGAPTKSGKPCRRKVRGGGRCYQHRGK